MGHLAWKKYSLDKHPSLLPISDPFDHNKIAFKSKSLLSFHIIVTLEAYICHHRCLQKIR